MEIPRKILAVMILVSLMPAFIYVTGIVFGPAGYIYNGAGFDDINTFISMGSVSRNFESPYAIEGNYTKIYDNVSFGSYLLFFPLGYLGYFSGIPLMALYAFARVLGFLAMFYFSYRLFRRIYPEKAGTMFTVFVFGAGLGWILYLSGTFYALGIGIFFMLNGYYVIPFAFAIASVLWLIEGRYARSSIALFFATLFYPMYFVAAAALFLAMLASGAFRIEKKKLFWFIIPLVALTPYVVAFGSPLTAQYMANEERFFASGIPLISLMVEGSIVLWLAFRYAGIRTWKKLAASIITGSLFLLGQLSQSFWTSSLSFARPYSIPLELPFLLFMGFIIFDTLTKEKEKMKRFLTVSFVLLLLLSVTPIDINPVIPYKLAPFLWLAVSIIFPFSIKGFSRGTQKNLLRLVIILSIPSIVAVLHYGFVVQQPHAGTEPVAYTPVDVANILRSLDDMPDGTVLTSPEIGTYLPLYTRQKTLLAIHPSDLFNYSEKLEAYNNYIKNNDTSVIARYNISYVLTRENGNAVLKIISNNSTKSSV